MVKPVRTATAKTTTDDLLVHKAAPVAAFFLVRPAGRSYLEVQVLYTPDTGKC